MKEWWDHLSLREKQTLLFGAICVTIFLLYEIVWSPLTNKVNSLRSEVPRNQTLLNWMQENDKKIQTLEKTLQNKSSSQSSSSLLGILQKEIQQSPFAKNLTQLKQAENNSVQLSFKQVEFDDLMKWLIQLWQQQGLTVTQLSVTASGTTPGMVSADLIIL